jgi:hypothetical protein
MANTPANPFRKVTLNGKRGKAKIAKPFIHALNTPAILTEKAGFLFKATVCGDLLVLGVTPYFIEGQRTWHYDMVMPAENEFTLLGAINADGHFTILFTPISDELTTFEQIAYGDNYIQFAQFLLASGLESEGPLDAITIQLLTEANVFHTPPTSLAELARLSLDRN